MHDAELILIGGALLALGIAAALIADKVQVPGLLLFLGLGMLVGSEGIGGVEFDDAELTRTLGTIGLVLILFEGGLTAGWKEIRPVLATAISLGTLGTILTALIAGVRLGLDPRPLDAGGPDPGLGDRRDRLGGDLRRAARVEAAAQGGALAGGRVRDERPGRPAAGDRLHRLDRGARLRPAGHGAGAGRRSWCSGPRWGSRSGSAARGTFRRLDYPTQGLYPVASIATAALAYGVTEVVARLGLPGRLPDGADPRHRPRARASARSSPSTRGWAGSRRSRSSSCWACSSSRASWSTSPARAC